MSSIIIHDIFHIFMSFTSMDNIYIFMNVLIVLLMHVMFVYVFAYIFVCIFVFIFIFVCVYVFAYVFVFRVYVILILTGSRDKGA